MSATILNITVDCKHPYDLARFWSDVLGRAIHPDNEPTDDEVGIPLDGGGELLFQAVPEPKSTKNRVHLCLQPDERRDEQIDRLLMIGARMHDDRRTADGRGWAVLEDPEGNEFCMLRSAAERH